VSGLINWRGEVAWISCAVSATPPVLRGRSGAGLGDHLDAAPHAGLAQGRTSHAKPASIYAAAVNEMSLGGTRPALNRTFWAVYLIPSNARQKGEPAICLPQNVQYRRDKPKVKAK
jgi:hypothetical protein